MGSDKIRLISKIYVIIFSMLTLFPLRGFVKLKKFQKSEKKLGSRWVGQAPTRIFFFLKYSVFLCCFFVVHVSKLDKTPKLSRWQLLLCA